MELKIVYGFWLDGRYEDENNEFRNSPYYDEKLLEGLVYYYTEVYIVLSDGSYKLLEHFNNCDMSDRGKKGFSYQAAKDYAERQAVLYNCKAEYSENVKDALNGSTG